MLTKYHGGFLPEYNDLVEFELAEIKTQLGAEAAAKEVSYTAFFKSKPNRWRLFVVLFTGFTGQLAGNGLVSYYLNLILNSIGISGAREQLLINGALMGYNIGTAIAAGFLVGKLRRRTTFLTGIAWMLICYICWTALSAVNQQRNFEQESLGRGVLAFIFLYYLGYNFALNALPNLVGLDSVLLRVSGWLERKLTGEISTSQRSCRTTSAPRARPFISAGKGWCLCTTGS